MNYETMAAIMEELFEKCRTFRAAGQKEYAHQEDNSFANFERISARLGISREAVLLVYMEKHIDGIHSWVQGHRSQREAVGGRIADAIVYLCLLYGMVKDLENGRGSTDQELPGMFRYYDGTTVQLHSIVNGVMRYSLTDNLNLYDSIITLSQMQWKQPVEFSEFHKIPRFARIETHAEHIQRGRCYQDCNECQANPPRSLPLGWKKTLGVAAIPGSISRPTLGRVIKPTSLCKGCGRAAYAHYSRYPASGSYCAPVETGEDQIFNLDESQEEEIIQ